MRLPKLPPNVASVVSTMMVAFGTLLMLHSTFDLFAGRFAYMVAGVIIALVLWGVILLPQKPKDKPPEAKSD